jgi:hypothetical protein
LSAIERVVVAGVYRNIVTEALSLVANPNVVVNKDGAGRGVRRSGIARWNAGRGYQFCRDLCSGRYHCEKGS